jgi:hypothetical protein
MCHVSVPVQSEDGSGVGGWETRCGRKMLAGRGSIIGRHREATMRLRLLEIIKIQSIPTADHFYRQVLNEIHVITFLEHQISSPRGNLRLARTKLLGVGLVFQLSSPTRTMFASRTVGLASSHRRLQRLSSTSPSVVLLTHLESRFAEAFAQPTSLCAHLDTTPSTSPLAAQPWSATTVLHSLSTAASPLSPTPPLHHRPFTHRVQSGTAANLR